MSLQQDAMPSTEQGHKVSPRSGNLCSAIADADPSKSFAFNPQAAAFNLAAQPLPSLSPLALPFIPTQAAPAPTSDSTETSSSSTQCPSVLNPIAPTFIPAPRSEPDTTESMTEITEQAWSATSTPVETSDFAEDACTREQLDVPDNEVSVNFPSLVTAKDTFDASSCSIASTADDMEYNNQGALIYQDPDIHHINWMGQGIMTKTSTPAAVSLTVALTPAKARFVDEENLRDRIVLREAMLYVDPVVFYGDLNQVKDLKGEALRDAAIGAAAVYYTPFGQWKNESFGEDDERPLTDELDLARYIEGTTIVNGWLENGAPTRQDFWKDAEEAYHTILATRKKATAKRKLFGVGHTSLRSVLVTDGSQHTVSAKLHLSADASGLISRTALLSEDAAASSSPLPVGQDDGLFNNANWADDLDDEDEINQVIQPPAANGCYSPSTSSDASSGDQSFNSSSISSSSNLESSAKPAAADGTGVLDCRLQEETDEDDEHLHEPAVEVESLDLSPTSVLTLPIRSKPVKPWTKEPPVLPILPAQVTQPICDKTTAEYVEESKALMASVLEYLKPKVEKHLETIGAFKSEEDSESREDWEGQSVACPTSCHGHPHAAVDNLNRYYEAPRHEYDHEAETTPGLRLRFIPAPTADASVLSALDSAEQHEPDVEEDEQVEIESSVEVEGLERVKEESAQLPSTPPEQILSEPTIPESPIGLPSDRWNECPAVDSPLKCEKGRASPQKRCVAPDHSNMIMPKFDLVPASLSAMFRTGAEILAQKLEEIQEEDEEQSDEDKLSVAGPHFAQTDEENEVSAKVDLAVPKGHVSLKRSYFCENLPALLLASAEDGSDEEPTMPERSPVPSPYKRPSSNTPNTMLGKKVKFAMPALSDSESCTTGAGAIFEDDEEEEIDASSILSGAVIYDGGAIYLQPAVASTSFPVSPAADSTSGSGSASDDIFTAPSAQTTAPSTVGSSREGSPSPSVIPQPAQRPAQVAEPSTAQVLLAESVSARPATENRSSSWASIKSKLSRTPSGGYTEAINVQFISVQRRSPSWTEVENKLWKPKPIAACQEQKKKKSGLRRAWKKVKNAFIKGVKALA